MNELVVVRHGERWDWQHPEWVLTTTRPWDTPLSEHGLEQAEQVATFLASRKEKPRKVLSSPLIRATQTALATARATGVAVCPELSMTEWPIRSPLPMYLLRGTVCTRPGDTALINDSWQTLHDPGLPLTESIAEAHTRGRMLYDAILAAERSGRLTGTVAVFGHAASCIALVRAALGDERRPCSFPVCGITLLRRTGTGKHDWAVELDGSAAHLSNNAEHTWSFELWLELERARTAKTPSL